MANISQLTSTLWTGGDIGWEPEDAAEDILDILEAGITHIIDCRLEWTDEDLFAEIAPEVTYFHHPVDDDGNVIADHWFLDGVRFAQRAFENPAHRLLVHCHMGINRGPSLAFAILLEQRTDPIEALGLIRRARPIAHMGYAEDALKCHLRQEGATAQETKAAVLQLRRWRRNNDIDVGHIIRGIRASEGGTQLAG